MSHIRHYQVLHNRTVNFAGKYRWSSRLANVSQASMITLKLLQWFKCKKQHKSLALTTYHYLIIRIIFQWFSSTLMLILSAIHHFVRTTLFIAYMPLAGSSTEQVFRYSYHEWWSRQQPRSCGITQNIGVVFVSKRRYFKDNCIQVWYQTSGSGLDKTLDIHVHFCGFSQH